MSKKARFTVGSNQYKQTPALQQPTGQAAYSLESAATPERTILHRSLIEARQGLCDALDALAEQREGLVIVGSHAVHERTKNIGIESTQTKDSDLAVVPPLFSAQPRIEEAMRKAGFRPLGEFTDDKNNRRFLNQPGLWGRGFDEKGAPVAEVDLIVPASMAGGGRRAPRAMSDHGKQSTRMAPGLELAAFDRDLMIIDSFESGSQREAYVAGFAALICAKSYKLGERIEARDNGKPDRVTAKDAGDMWRLMAASDPRTVASNFDEACETEGYEPVARTGLAYLRTTTNSGELLSLAAIDLGGSADRDDIETTYDNWTSTFFESITAR